MEDVLIVSSTRRGADFLSEILKEKQARTVTVSESGNEARRLLMEKTFDFVFVNTPLVDETGPELALFVTRQTSAGSILLVNVQYADEVSARVEDYGVFVLQKPINCQFLFQAIKLIETSRKRMMGLETEKLRLKQKIEEIRLVDRAKYTLMQHLKMTEAQAHRYIEKQAMDMRQQKSEVAKRVLQMYEE